MKARLHGDAHDFKGARVLAVHLGNLQALDLGLTLQQRDHAGLHIFLGVIVKALGQARLDQLCGV